LSLLVNNAMLALELASHSVAALETLAHRQCFQNRNAVVAGWQWCFHAGAMPVAVRVARAIGYVATDAGPAFVANTSSRSRVAVSMATAVDLVTWTSRYVTPVAPPSVEPAIAHTGVGAVALKKSEIRVQNVFITTRDRLNNDIKLREMKKFQDIPLLNKNLGVFLKRKALTTF